MFKFLATAVLALSAVQVQAALCHSCTSNGLAEHGLSLDAPIKVCPTRNCGSSEDPNGASDHGAIQILDVPGKVCPTRACNGNEDPNGSAEHGLSLDAPIKVCPTRGCGQNEDPNGTTVHGLKQAR